MKNLLFTCLLLIGGVSFAFATVLPNNSSSNMEAFEIADLTPPKIVIVLSGGNGLQSGDFDSFEATNISSGKVKVQIIDGNGEEVHKLVLRMQQTKAIDVQGFLPGHYHVVATPRGERPITVFRWLRD